ncbi:MAG: hypothetical protein QOH84_1758 [Kribbellaceae bacterium]|nr:hypothetical protein [Kribbellaceae bacterium]
MRSVATTMIGRDVEWGRLSATVTAAGGGAVVVRGEAGVGKSTLLDRAAALAEQEGYDVVRAAGVEAESELPYAGLHQFLYPLLPHVGRLEAGPRSALETVFGQSTGNPPSVMSLGIAVLALLSLAASEKPQLLLLDDGHWLDGPSADVCGFVGRRLAGTPVKLVIALRTDVASPFDSAALEEVSVQALGQEAAARLLDEQHPELDRRVRELVLDQARGNPLALLELALHVGGDQDGATSELLGYRGPLPRRLQHLYGTRIEALSEAVRRELLLGALDGAGAGPTAGEVRGLRYRMRDADEAVANGLLDIDPATGEFVFRHPLVRSAVVQLATPNQRRAAHAALAELHRENVERRATHLAVATVDPDETVAAVLEAAATSATRRGGAGSAVAWMTRAAELSENHDDRSRRLGNAAFIAGQAARLDQAQRLVLSDLTPSGGESPAAVVAAAYLALYENGDVRSSQRQVMTAIENIRRDGPTKQTDVLTRLVNLLLAINQYESASASWERTHQLLDALGDLIPERSRIYGSAWSDVIRHGADLPQRVERAFSDQSGLEPWEMTRLAVAAYHVDTLSSYRPYLQRTVDREVETGAVANGMTMLHLIMLDQMALGEWDEAERTGQRGLELTTRHGCALFAYQGRAYLALLAAMRGRLDLARELRATVDSWARPRGIGFLTQIADAAGTAAALSEGDYETAYLHAVGITTPGTFRPYAHQAARTLLDLVEAAVHTGREEEARLHAVAARDAGLPDLSPRLALITYGALAMTAANEKESIELYTKAETHPAAATFPFELARIQLAHGTRLRHTQGPRAARDLLTRAAEAFERLGATTWAERAMAELRASGVAATSVATSLGALTWQERRIAELAAGGLSNKEIGERLHLSPRTVSSHLYRVFPKLGITARAGLRDALARTHGLSEV